MKQYGLENIRNVVLLSHSGSGKTSFSEAALFTAGVINRLGKVDEGTTTPDYDPDEIKRKISINLKLLPCPWQDTKINIIDTPGYPDFVGEVHSGIRVSEGVVILVCAASGVEVGTERVWGSAEQAGLPRLIVMNKMDRENANFQRTLGEIKSKLGARCMPLQLPIGAQGDFQGVIDLLTMKAYLGSAAEATEVPAALQEEARSLREKLVEAVAELDDKLLEKYLGGEELSLEELSTGLRQGVLAGKIAPVLAGSALKNIGIRWLLDAVCRYLPSPAEREFNVLSDSETKNFKPSPDAPLAALVFKTTADPYVGKLTYFRVYQGVIQSNSQVWNATRGENERVGQLYLIRGKNQEGVPQITAGDIGAVAKLNVTSTGDTLTVKDRPVRLPAVQFPAPIFSKAVYPRTKVDLDKMGNALSRLTEEDPTLHVSRDPHTGETIVSGMGDTHIDVAADKMLRKFGAAVELALPKVPYRETITVPTEAEFKHKKQTGGHGQYGHVLLRLEPLERGAGNEFVDAVVGGAVPRNYIPAVEKGVHEAVLEGGLSGYPVADVRATLYDGSFHAVDSSDVCFKIAGAGAFKKGMSQGQPMLLEPIMKLKVTIPENYTGDIISDLNTKRARVQGMIPEDGNNTIEAEVPLAEIQRYAIDLRSITQGRGSFTVEFSHYEPVPTHITEKIIAEKQAQKEKAQS